MRIRQIASIFLLFFLLPLYTYAQQQEENTVFTMVAKAKFARNDFFLYYPLPDRAFRPIEGTDKVMYYEGKENELHISTNQGEDRLFSMTYEDKMYFSAPGEYGGYDLFCSTWDSVLGEWGEPKNMGNPYSSEGDDLLFMQTEDGKFNLFASNRACSSDSVYVYVLENNGHLNESTNLISNIQSVSMVNSSSTTTPTTNWAQKYQDILEKQREVSALLDQASEQDRPQYEEQLEQLETEKSTVEEHIFSNNNQTRSISEELDREVVGVDGSFIFLKRNIGKSIKLIITY